MKIMSWNVRGSGSRLKRGSIKEVVFKEDRNILVLQELKREEVKRRFISSIWKSRFKEWVFLPSMGRSRGILVVWDVRRVNVVESLIGDFSVSIHVRRDGEDWWFTGIYDPTKSLAMGSFWYEIVGLWVVCGGNWCLGGDFNAVRNVNEKENSSTYTRSMRRFDELIREKEVIDLLVVG